MLASLLPASLRCRVNFAGEGGSDYGGLYRECISNLCEDLQSDYLPLLLPSPNMEHGLINRDKWIINPGARSPRFVHIVGLVFFGPVVRVMRLVCSCFVLLHAFSIALCSHMRMFEFLGILIGMSIQTNYTLNVDFPSVTWKILVRVWHQPFMTF